MEKIDKDFNERLHRTVTKLENEGQKVQVIGEIKNGKIVLDQQSLEALAKRFPDATMAFLAINFPFDPGSRVGK